MSQHHSALAGKYRNVLGLLSPWNTLLMFSAHFNFMELTMDGISFQHPLSREQSTSSYQLTLSDLQEREY
jgi:hypothetical protein